MIHRSYVMHFRQASMEDMQKMQALCEMLRMKGTCFSITDIEIRGQKGYEVFWYINPENNRMTRFGQRDRRRH